MEIKRLSDEMINDFALRIGEPTFNVLKKEMKIVFKEVLFIENASIDDLANITLRMLVSFNFYTTKLITDSVDASVRKEIDHRHFAKDIVDNLKKIFKETYG
jgi:hypothetical protein